MNYTVTAIVTALVILVALHLAVLALGALMGKLSWGGLIIWGVLSAVVICLLVMVVLPALRVRPQPVSLDPALLVRDPVRIESYGLVLSRVRGRGFQVKDQVLVLTRHGRVALQPRQRIIRGASVGAFVKQVAINLECNPAVAQIHAESRAVGPLNRVPCPDSIQIRLTMPADMFYQAQGGASVTRTQFVNTETIEWSVPRDRQPISFAYLAPPAHIVKPFFPDSVWAHSGGRLAVLALAFVVTTIVFPIMIGLGVELLKKPLEKK